MIFITFLCYIKIYT